MVRNAECWSISPLTLRYIYDHIKLLKNLNSCIFIVNFFINIFYAGNCLDSHVTGGCFGASPDLQNIRKGCCTFLYHMNIHTIMFTQFQEIYDIIFSYHKTINLILI